MVQLPPEGTSSHRTLVVPGAGIPRMDQAMDAGNHFVKVGIKVPKLESLTKRQRELIKLFSLLEPAPENGLVSSDVIKRMYTFGPVH